MILVFGALLRHLFSLSSSFKYIGLFVSSLKSLRFFFSSNFFLCSRIDLGYSHWKTVVFEWWTLWKVYCLGLPYCMFVFSMWPGHVDFFCWCCVSYEFLDWLAQNSISSHYEQGFSLGCGGQMWF